MVLLGYQETTIREIGPAQNDQAHTSDFRFEFNYHAVAVGSRLGRFVFFGEIALREVPPLTITLHRVVWALPILALIVLFKGISVPRSPKIWGAYLVMGALNNAIPFSLIFWGQTQIESGLASILNGTTAMFAAVVAGLLLREEPLTAKKIIGAALGIAGVAFIMGPSALTDFNPSNLAQLAILGAKARNRRC